MTFFCMFVCVLLWVRGVLGWGARKLGRLGMFETRVFVCHGANWCLYVARVTGSRRYKYRAARPSVSFLLIHHLQCLIFISQKFHHQKYVLFSLSVFKIHLEAILCCSVSSATKRSTIGMNVCPFFCLKILKQPEHVLLLSSCL
jgi:hypothetical protein